MRRACSVHSLRCVPDCPGTDSWRFVPRRRCGKGFWFPSPTQRKYRYKRANEINRIKLPVARWATTFAGNRTAKQLLATTRATDGEPDHHHQRQHRTHSALPLRSRGSRNSPECNKNDACIHFGTVLRTKIIRTHKLILRCGTSEQSLANRHSEFVACDYAEREFAAALHAISGCKGARVKSYLCDKAAQSGYDRAKKRVASRLWR